MVSIPFAISIKKWDKASNRNHQYDSCVLIFGGFVVISHKVNFGQCSSFPHDGANLNAIVIQ